MSRRGHREGEIRKRRDGRWEARLSFGYRNGKRVRRSFYGDTRQEVHEKLTKSIREWQLGILVAPHTQTVAEYLRRWLTDSAKPRLRPRTFDGYEQHVEKNIIPVLGTIRLQKLRPQDVQRLVREKSAAGLAPRTVRYIRAVLRTALTQAVKWDLIPKNPALAIDLPRVARRELQVLDIEQAKRLIAAAKKDRLSCLFTVAVAMGLRLGEVLGLKWEDLDLSAKTLRVSRALQRVDGTAQFVEPKSDTSRRTLNLPEFAVEAFKRHRTRQKKERLIAGSKWREFGLIFTSPIGTPLDDSHVRKVFKALLRTAKLPDIRLHDLRHTCATLLLAQGVHPKLVQETLGHSQISLTLDTYTHVLPSLKKEVAEKMDAALGTR